MPDTTSCSFELISEFDICIDNAGAIISGWNIVLDFIIISWEPNKYSICIV